MGCVCLDPDFGDSILSNCEAADQMTTAERRAAASKMTSGALKEYGNDGVIKKEGNEKFLTELGQATQLQRQILMVQI